MSLHRSVISRGYVYSAIFRLRSYAKDIFGSFCFNVLGFAMVNDLTKYSRVALYALRGYGNFSKRLLGVLSQVVLTTSSTLYANMVGVKGVGTFFAVLHESSPNYSRLCVADLRKARRKVGKRVLPCRLCIFFLNSHLRGVMVGAYGVSVVVRMFGQ